MRQNSPCPKTHPVVHHSFICYQGQVKKDFCYSGLLPKTHSPLYWKETQLTSSYADFCLPPQDLSLHMSLQTAIAKLAKSLSFFEQVALIEKLEHSHASFCLEAFVEDLGYSHQKNLNAFVSFAKKLPPKFKSWASHKKLGPKDLRGFLKSTSEELKVFELIGQLNPSKSLGLECLDLSLDLLAAHKVSLQSLSSFTKPEVFIKFLKKERFHKTLAQDEKLSHALSKVELKSGIKISIKREGDTRKLICEMKSSSPQDLETKVEQLKKQILTIKENWSV